MPTPRATRLASPPGSTLLLILLPLLGLAATRAAGQDRPAPAPSAEERAIRDLDEVFIRDYARGDSKALAALFAEDAEVVEADGTRYRGRGPVEESFAATFAASPGAKIAFEIDSIRFLGPDVAKEEGRTTVTPTRGASTSTLYTVLYVRRDGKWLISSVREEDDPSARPRDRLKELEWMIGDWMDEGSDSEVRAHCAWSEDGNFLMRTFTVRRQGRPVMTVTQRVGWDPLSRQFRSWEFDSEGGFGEGTWSRSGDRWVVRHSAVRPEGTRVSATNILTRQRPDLVRWDSVDRSVGGEALPDDRGYTLVKVPPAPPSPTSLVTPKPTSSLTRSPR